jgi:hypothetical protein
MSIGASIFGLERLDLTLSMRHFEIDAIVRRVVSEVPPHKTPIKTRYFGNGSPVPAFLKTKDRVDNSVPE